jgi:hypothetical protein
MFSATVFGAGGGRIGTFGLSYDKNSIYYGYAGFPDAALSFFQTYVNNTTFPGEVGSATGSVITRSRGSVPRNANIMLRSDDGINISYYINGAIVGSGPNIDTYRITNLFNYGFYTPPYAGTAGISGYSGFTSSGFFLGFNSVTNATISNILFTPLARGPTGVIGPTGPPVSLVPSCFYDYNSTGPNASTTGGIQLGTGGNPTLISAKNITLTQTSFIAAMSSGNFHVLDNQAFNSDVSMYINFKTSLTGSGQIATSRIVPNTTGLSMVVMDKSATSLAVGPHSIDTYAYCNTGTVFCTNADTLGFGNLAA